MSITIFEPNIQWENELLFLASRYNIPVPKGLAPSDVRQPIYVTAERMQQLNPRKEIKVVAGLTKAEFSVRFDNLYNQWQPVSSNSTNPKYQFQGGRVHFQIRLGVYVLEGFRSFANILSVIMEHELLHVQDEIDIAERFLRSEAPKEPLIKRYLIDKRPVDQSMFNNWFRGKGFEEWVRDGIWAPETNRRVKIRDSGPEWNRYRERIDALMRGTGSSGK